jgi:hypothetical protein
MISAVIERGAGIDVEKTILLVCTMVGPLDQEPLTETCTFGTTNADLDRLRSLVSGDRVYSCRHGKYRVLLEAGLQCT